jgi:hypothetical protein
MLTLGLFFQSAMPLAMPLGSQPAEDSIIRQVSIDKAGVVAYIKDDGIYTSGRAGGVRRQVAVGDEAPRTGGRFAAFLDLSSATVDLGLAFTNELRIVFKATIEGGTVSEGIFIFTENRGIDVIALPGDIAPNTGGGTFGGFPGRVLMSSLGTVMFRATVTGGRAVEGLFFAPRGFLMGEADIESVAVQGDAAPETGTGAFTSFGEYSLVEDAVPPLPSLKLDRFAFIANVEGGRVAQGLFMSAFVLLTVPSIQVELLTRAVAVVGDDVQGLRGPSAYASFEDVVLTKKELVFRAHLDGGDVSEGIFQLAILGGLLEFSSPRVLQGDRAPINRTQARFVEFGRMVGNDVEQLFFEATLQGNGPPQGLFLVTLGPLQLKSETLSVGDEAPTTEGGVYSTLGPLAVNDDGVVAIQARLDGGIMSEGVFTVQGRRSKFVDGIPR